MHLKRHFTNKSWPIPRKGTAYVVVPSHSPDSGVPLLIAIRDILGAVKTRKELKKILLEGKVLVNGKKVREDNLTVQLFDKISLKDEKKYYEVEYSKTGKFDLKEISEKDANSKICKVINKKMLKGKQIQINFNDGRNMLSKEKLNIGESIVINLNDNKIEKIMPVKEKAKVLIVKGKHRGSKGDIVEINENKIKIKSDDKSFETKMEELIVIN
jgi:small subunit ribosomal protein S4e